jgi:putative membrane protein
MKKMKLIFIFILALLSIIIIIIIIIIILLQNRAPIETKILFMTLTMPRAVLLFITMLVGFALGILVSLLVVKK